MGQRRAVIDAIRGLCLVNIFVNHIEGGYLTLVSPSRLGFSDSSDIFVLLSGVSTALAYGHRQGGLVVLLWRRAAELYAFNVAIVLATIGLLTTILIWRGPVGVNAPEAALLAEHGAWSLLSHALSLRQTVGFSSVLRLYVALMLLAPVLVRLSQWRWWAPIAAAAPLWLLAGHFRLVVPNSLTGEPFMLTVLPWTLIFAIGVALGRAMTLGIPLPRSRLALILAGSVLVGYLVLSVLIVRVWPAAYEWAAVRNDHFWLGASKTYQSPLRVLHVLSLAYIVVALRDAPVIRLLHQARPNHPLCRLGRHSLVVFTLGAVAAMAFNELLDLARLSLEGAVLPSIALELAAFGLYLGLALWIAERRSRAGRSEAREAREMSPPAWA